ncbi:unnamed protein product, partial [marine sediment metagenome]
SFSGERRWVSSADPKYIVSWLLSVLDFICLSAGFNDGA